MNFAMHLHSCYTYTLCSTAHHMLDYLTVTAPRPLLTVPDLRQCGRIRSSRAVIRGRPGEGVCISIIDGNRDRSSGRKVMLGSVESVEGLSLCFVLAVAMTAPITAAAFFPGQAAAGALDRTTYKSHLSCTTTWSDQLIPCLLDLKIATLNGSLLVRTHPPSNRLPLLLAAYNAHDATSRSVFL